MAITKEMLEKLRSVGWSFGEYEKTVGLGQVFHYQGVEHTIGGSWDASSLSEEDQTIIREGIWLPNTDDLMYWLWCEGVSVKISCTAGDGYFHSEGILSTGECLTGGGPDLQMCLYKLVFKVARHHHQIK